jgi:peptide/nickel transport system substrate-binding protein
MRNKKKITRREFLQITAMAVGGTTLAACGTATPAPATSAPQPTKAVAVPTTASVSKYKEAPAFAELVKAGKLPPLDERLPENPRVITPKQQVGKYGGVWHRGYKGVADRWGLSKVSGEENMIQWLWEGDAPKAVANTIEKWEQNADASEFTFYLRKGIKYSDGTEFTTDDIKFWYEDVYLNPDLTPGHAGTVDNADRTPSVFTIVDPYTFKIKFNAPRPMLGIFIAKGGLGIGELGGPTFAYPKYMRQWHEKYGDKAAIDAQLTRLKLAKWTELWSTGGNSGDFQGPMAFWFLNPDLPVIKGWVMKNKPPEDPLVLERNPYFWKVDTEGNQLPYIDRIEHVLFSDQQTLNMWFISGQIDCQFRFTDPGSYTLYKENEAKGGYKVQKNIQAQVSCFGPNITTPDPVLAKLFDTPDFRKALSISINRDDINDLVYNGLLRPMQASPVHGSPNFDEEFSNTWIDYDPEAANALLDGLGLKMGSDGKTRTRPDGKPLEISIETYDPTGSQALDECNQVAKYWSAVGVKTNVSAVERSLWEQHSHDGTMEVPRWQCDRNAIVMADPIHYLGVAENWATLYGHWYTNSSYKQVEPPADHPLREIWKLWEQCQVEPDETIRNAYFKSLLDIHKAHPWMIGTVGEAPALWIVKNNFHNVPEGYIEDDVLRDYGVMEPWQFYMDPV